MMRSEMTVEDFESDVIVDVGAEMDVLGWQDVQAEDA